MQILLFLSVFENIHWEEMAGKMAEEVGTIRYIGYGVRGWPGRAAGLKPGQTAISNRYSRKHWTTVLQDESINLPLNSDRNCAFAQMFARDSRFSYDREIIFA